MRVERALVGVLEFLEKTLPLRRLGSLIERLDYIQGHEVIRKAIQYYDV